MKICKYLLAATFGLMIVAAVGCNNSSNEPSSNATPTPPAGMTNSAATNMPAAPNK